MQHCPVDSTNIASMAHEGDVLEVRFRNGRLYQFFGVPSSVFRGVRGAESAGEEFGRLVRNRYRYEEVR